MKYCIRGEEMSNFEDILHKRLMLSRLLSKNEAKKLNIANTHFGDEENIFQNNGFVVLI